jgi:hypothetical protein
VLQIRQRRQRLRHGHVRRPATRSRRVSASLTSGSAS